MISSISSKTNPSTVNNEPATEAPFSNAQRIALVASTTPVLKKFSYVPDKALKP